MGWLNPWSRKPRPRPARRVLPARPGVEVLEQRQVPTVTYHGGALLTHVEAQPLFLGSEWSANQAAAVGCDVGAAHAAQRSKPRTQRSGVSDYVPCQAFFGQTEFVRGW